MLQCPPNKPSSKIEDLLQRLKQKRDRVLNEKSLKWNFDFRADSNQVAVAMTEKSPILLKKSVVENHQERAREKTTAAGAYENLIIDAEIAKSGEQKCEAKIDLESHCELIEIKESSASSIYA